MVAPTLAARTLRQVGYGLRLAGAHAEAAEEGDAASAGKQITHLFSYDLGDDGW